MPFITLDHSLYDYFNLLVDKCLIEVNSFFGGSLMFIFVFFIGIGGPGNPAIISDFLFWKLQLSHGSL